MREYFENVIKPLATNEKLEELLKELFKEKNSKIVELELKFAMKQTTIDNIEIKCDVNKQYTRKSCVRIHGLDFISDHEK